MRATESGERFSLAHRAIRALLRTKVRAPRGLIEQVRSIFLVDASPHQSRLRFMSKTAVRACFIRAALRTLIHAEHKRMVCLLLAGLFMALVPARADEPEDVYLRIYSMAQQADTMKANGQSVAALAKYREAHKALLNFQREYPQWNKQVVTYRLNDL